MSTRRKTTASTGTQSTTSRRKSGKTGSTSARKTGGTAAKSRVTKPVAATPATAKTPEVPKATVVSDTTPTTTAPMMKKRELLNLVVERSGVRKKFAKPTVEAMMEILGEAIAEGRDLNLPPMGKIKQQRTKEASNVRVTVAKIRQGKIDGPEARDSDQENPGQGVADAAE
jgi:DNA-binding protein HU-alpha